MAVLGRNQESNLGLFWLESCEGPRKTGSSSHEGVQPQWLLVKCMGFIHIKVPDNLSVCRASSCNVWCVCHINSMKLCGWFSSLYFIKTRVQKGNMLPVFFVEFRCCIYYYLLLKVAFPKMCSMGINWCYSKIMFYGYRF